VQVDGRRPLHFSNTNPLVKNSNWEIGISKTGYISESGVVAWSCKAKITNRPMVIVLLDSWENAPAWAMPSVSKNWMENSGADNVRHVSHRIR